LPLLEQELQLRGRLRAHLPPQLRGRGHQSQSGKLDKQIPSTRGSAGRIDTLVASRAMYIVVSAAPAPSPPPAAATFRRGQTHAPIRTSLRGSRRPAPEFALPRNRRSSSNRADDDPPAPGSSASALGPRRGGREAEGTGANVVPGDATGGNGWSSQAAAGGVTTHDSHSATAATV
jgi:hypothetical protein